MRRPASVQKNWYRIKNVAAARTAEVSIYNEIGLYGVSAAAFVGELAQIDADLLNVRINSPGGEIFEGLAILNALRSHPAAVSVYVDGLAASIASVIAMAGDRITMMPNSQFMVHDGSGLCVGNEADMREMADLLAKQSENIASIYAQRAGGSRPQWRKRMRAETWYSAEEAVKAGLADEVAKMSARKMIPEPTPEGEEEVAEYGMAASFDLSMFRYAGREQAPEPPLANQDQPASEPEEPEEDMPGMQARAVGPHESDTAEGDWDAGENVGRLPSPVPVDTVAEVFALYDEERVEDGAVPKDACALPHHFVSADGTPGAASMAGVRAGLARLSQTEGYSQEELDTARRHLQAHLADGGGEPGEEPEGEEPEARTAVDLTAWSPDAFRAAMSKATEVLPEDFTDIFRNAVAAAAGTAAAPARPDVPAPDPESLGWRPADQPAPERETAHSIFHNAITTAAESAPAVPGRPDPGPEPDSLGWAAPPQEPEPVPESFARLFHDAVAREANQAPAVVTKPAPEPEPDHYDPTVIMRALREATK